MLKYSCERLNIDENAISTIKDLEKILNEKVQNGYKYIGYVPIETGSSGKLYNIGLVFKKD